VSLNSLVGIKKRWPGSAGKLGYFYSFPGIEIGRGQKLEPYQNAPAMLYANNEGLINNAIYDRLNFLIRSYTCFKFLELAYSEFLLHESDELQMEQGSAMFFWKQVSEIEA
jgi:hypothetical protein